MSLAAIVGIILNLALPKTVEEIEEKQKKKSTNKNVKKVKKA